MAQIFITYCNANLGRTIELDYDDVTHTIDSSFLAEPCSTGGVASGTIVYTDSSGYTVKAQNTIPYAYVVPPAPECFVTIDSVTPADSATDQSNDGSVAVTATAIGLVEYSLDEISWQSSGNFFGLAPGNYTVYARSQVTERSSYCYDSENFVIDYTDIVCELLIDNTSFVNPTTASSNDGSIQINTVIDPRGLELQYKIDAGAWGGSNVFTGLDEGTFTVYVRYKNFTSCEDSRVIVLVAAAVSCNIQITNVNVVHEQTRYADNGIITVTATSSAGGLQYRINGGAYQSSNVFAGLSPGDYTIDVKDANDCLASTITVVYKYKISVFDWPVVNSLRAVPTSGSFITSSLQNFDNTLFRNMQFPGVSACNYAQKVTFEDSLVLQFRSSYSSNVLRIYNSSNVLQKTITATKEIDYLNQQDQRPASFADAGAGEVQMFFSEGMPDFYKVGMDITITEQAGLNGSYELTDIRAGNLDADGYSVAIFTKAWPGGTVLGATVTIDYAAEDFDVYQVAINMADLSAGNYYGILTGTDVQLGTYTAEVEPFALAATWPNTLKIDYRNNDDAFKIIYSTGISHRIRVEGELIWPLPGGNRTIYRDSTNRIRKVAENVTRQPQLFVYDLPPYLLEKIALAFGHDNFTVEDVEYQTEEDFKPEYFRNDAFGNGECKLEDVNFLADNSDDGGDVDNNIILDINNTLMSLNP